MLFYGIAIISQFCCHTQLYEIIFSKKICGLCDARVRTGSDERSEFSNLRARMRHYPRGKRGDGDSHRENGKRDIQRQQPAPREQHRAEIDYSEQRGDRDKSENDEHDRFERARIVVFLRASDGTDQAIAVECRSVYVLRNFDAVFVLGQIDGNFISVAVRFHAVELRFGEILDGGALVAIQLKNKRIHQMS